MNKKTIIIISSVAGALVLGFIGYRIISRWNKTIVKDGNTTILISKDESENVEVVSGDEEASGGDKEINLPDDLQEFETQSGLGDY
jgi:uncharacterized protein YdeI (YjbR/CyaY-like superfamily)